MRLEQFFHDINKRSSAYYSKSGRKAEEFSSRKNCVTSERRNSFTTSGFIQDDQWVFGKIPFKILIATLLFLVTTSPLFAQSDSSRARFFPTALNDTKTFFSDAGTLFCSPARFTANDWIKTGIIIGGTSALFLIDRDVRNFSQRNQSTTSDHIFNGARIYGEDYFGTGLSAGLYLTGFATKNIELRKTGLMVFESFIFSAVITQTIKFIAGRSRPYTNEGNTDFRFFQFEEDHISLPSGHSTAAFAISTVLAERIDNIYAEIGLYSLASLTAYSRIYTDNHWLSDTFLGAAIGYYIGKGVISIHSDQKGESSISIIPTRQGIMVLMQFP